MFVVALKKSKGPVLWQTTHGMAIVAFADESLAYYFTSQYKSRVLREALVLPGHEATRRLPLLSTIYRMLVLPSAEAVDALIGEQKSAHDLIEMRRSPWWVSPAKSGRKPPRFSVPLE